MDYRYRKQTSRRDGAKANRLDKAQPIIIQNFELLTPGVLTLKRRSLSTANLYLSSASLSRHGVTSEDKNSRPTTHQTSRSRAVERDDSNQSERSDRKQGSAHRERPANNSVSASKKRVTFRDTDPTPFGDMDQRGHWHLQPSVERLHTSGPGTTTTTNNNYSNNNGNHKITPGGGDRYFNDKNYQNVNNNNNNDDDEDDDIFVRNGLNENVSRELYDKYDWVFDKSLGLTSQHLIDHSLPCATDSSSQSLVPGDNNPSTRQDLNLRVDESSSGVKEGHSDCQVSEGSASVKGYDKSLHGSEHTDNGTTSNVSTNTGDHLCSIDNKNEEKGGQSATVDSFVRQTGTPCKGIDSAQGKRDEKTAVKAKRVSFKLSGDDENDGEMFEENDNESTIVRVDTESVHGSEMEQGSSVSSLRPAGHYEDRLSYATKTCNSAAFRDKTNIVSPEKGPALRMAVSSSKTKTTYNNNNNNNNHRNHIPTREEILKQTRAKIIRLNFLKDSEDDGNISRHSSEESLESHGEAQKGRPGSAKTRSAARASTSNDSHETAPCKETSTQSHSDTTGHSVQGRKPSVPEASKNNGALRTRTQGEINSEFLMRMYSASGARRPPSQEAQSAQSQSLPDARQNPEGHPAIRKTPGSGRSSRQRHRQSAPAATTTTTFTNYTPETTIPRAQDMERRLLSATPHRAPRNLDRRPRAASAMARSEVSRDRRSTMRENVFDLDSLLLSTEAPKIAERTKLNRRLEKLVASRTVSVRLKLALDRSRTTL